jgi:hypothetical protein
MACEAASYRQRQTASPNQGWPAPQQAATPHIQLYQQIAPPPTVCALPARPPFALVSVLALNASAACSFYVYALLYYLLLYA